MASISVMVNVSGGSWHLFVSQSGRHISSLREQEGRILTVKVVLTKSSKVVRRKSRNLCEIQAF